MENNTDTDMESAVQWARIFNALGEEQLRGALYDVLVGLDGDETRTILEFAEGTEGEVIVLEITDHVNKLEADAA